MGAGAAKAGLSNGTNFEIKMKFHTDKIDVTSHQYKNAMEITGKLAGGAKAPGVGGVEGEISGGYKNEEEHKYEYANHKVDPYFNGFMTVHAGTRFPFDNYDPQKSYYLSAYILTDDGPYAICENFEITFVNICIGEGEDGKFGVYKLHKDRTWRIDP